MYLAETQSRKEKVKIYRKNRRFKNSYALSRNVFFNILLKNDTSFSLDGFIISFFLYLFAPLREKKIKGFL